MDFLYGLPVNLALLFFLIGCAGLDALFGDPTDWPHPVRLIGWALDGLEGWGRNFWGGAVAGGFVSVLLVGLGSGGLVYVLTSLPLIGELFALYLGYAGLALGCLLRETDHVLALLRDGRLAAARAHLGGLVSRDTTDMTEEDIRRSVAETLAENFNDGFVAPFFWLSLLGPGALWAYKAVSTMDSMWGYRTERFEKLGKAAARADDLLAWVPARLSAVWLWLAGVLAGRRVLLAQVACEARTMDSPNAGWPMSAAAHVAGATMGGPTVYFGEVKDKPVLGPVDQPWTEAALGRLRRAVMLAGVLHIAALGFLGSWLEFWQLG